MIGEREREREQVRMGEEREAERKKTERGKEREDTCCTLRTHYDGRADEGHKT